MNNKITIGRAKENNLQVDQSYSRVSNYHATIEIQNGELIFIDHSTNGSLINGRFLHNSSMKINRGDELLLANIYNIEWSSIIKELPSLYNQTEIFDIAKLKDDERITERLGERSNQKYSTLKEKNLAEANVGQLNDFTQVEIDEYLEKFNLGAFLSTWVWAGCNRIYWPLWIIPISFIPYFGQVMSMFLCSFLGIRGNKLAWHRSKSSFTKFVSSQRKWIWKGIFIFLLFSFIQIIVLYTILSY